MSMSLTTGAGRRPCGGGRAPVAKMAREVGAVDDLQAARRARSTPCARRQSPPRTAATPISRRDGADVPSRGVAVTRVVVDAVAGAIARAISERAGGCVPAGAVVSLGRPRVPIGPSARAGLANQADHEVTAEREVADEHDRGDQGSSAIAASSCRREAGREDHRRGASRAGCLGCLPERRRVQRM